MITFEVAQKLKDAGFPPPGYKPGQSSWIIGENTYGAVFTLSKGQIFRIQIFPGYCYNAEHFVYIPTLSELIEACGRKYTEPSGKTYEFALILSNDEWFATYMDQKWQSCTLPDGIGKTAEEAVANLYLILNRKS